jgi:predicted esterase
MKHRKVTGLNWVNGWVRGLLEYTPPGYDPTDMVTKYPLIIYFHGVGGSGNGTAPTPEESVDGENGYVGLCRILTDVTTNVSRSLPALIEQQNNVLNHSGAANPYIVISPQFTGYNYPTNFPSSEEVAGVVDSIFNRYRADPRRVYLVGMSSGSNMVMEYVGSSVERARKIAAVAAPALCSVHDTTENVERGITPANIGLANLPVWLMQCESDQNCARRIPEGWIDGIVDAGGMAPRYHILDAPGGLTPTPSLPCNTNNPHDAWNTMFQPTFSDGPNLYNWFIQYQSSIALPVVLSAYRVTLANGKVKIEWETTHELNNESFTIERAGPDQRFTQVARIPAANIEQGKKPVYR